ncbi:MAG: MFS transporter [Pseudomonadota bacterium]
MYRSRARVYNGAAARYGFKALIDRTLVLFAGLRTRRQNTITSKGEQAVNDPSRSKRVLATGLIGNVLEWYDFAVYGFFATIIAGHFFPADNPTTSLIAAFGAFAAGFLMRPIGAIVFGRIGDTFGRRRMLFLSVMLMAIPTFLIGILPTHEQIGIMAAVLIVLLRMLQGLSVGGEYTGSIVYLIEQAPREKRALYASFSMMGATIGIMLGSGVGALISSLLTAEQLQSWGWRVPFLLGISIGALGFVIRRGLPESPSGQTEPTPLKNLFFDYRRQMLQSIGLNTMGAVCFYLIFVYLVTWIVDEVHETQSTALQINTLSLLVLLIATPAMATLSDRFGRRPMLLAGSLAMAFGAYPLILLMHHEDFWLILAGESLFALILATFMGSIPSFMAELFPTSIRATATSVSYNIPYAIFGGTAPMVAVWLIAVTDNADVIAAYLVMVSLIAFAIALRVNDRTGQALH